MLIAKTVPEGIKDRECERFALQECPLVPYVPEKDPVQEMVSLLKSDLSLKMTIGADAELRLPIWHCGTREAFLMHVSSALNAIEKQGPFKAYKEVHEVYVEQCKVAKQLKADMNLFMTPTSKGKKATKKGTEQASDKASGKNRSVKEKALRRSRKARLRPMHLPQNFAKNTRPSTKQPCSQKRPPTTRKKPLQPRCFSFTQTCCLWMQSTRGTR